MNTKAETLCRQAHNLKTLFEPKAIAVIGASRRKEAVGYAILNNLLTGGFKGKIYPVNPKAESIEDLKCFPSVRDLPDSVDLAILIVPSTSVPETLKACGDKGIPSAVIISAGFREIGGEGTKLEKELMQVAERFGINVLGPNCLGLINTDTHVAVNASFSRTMPTPGNIAFVSQSGALCAAILDYAKGENIGFSKFVSLGNKADLNELDLLRYLKDDPETSVILMYLEDLVEGRAFIELAREISGDQKHRKPILAIKAGRTPQGAKAASSHTGSLMGSDEVYDAIFAQAGVLRIDSVAEMFHFAVAFANQPLPKGNRVAIVTNAGGPGIMATDACVRYGLEMATLARETVEALRKTLPPTANLSNPIDVVGDAQHDRYEQALTYAVQDPHVDSVIVLLTPQAMTDIEEIAKVIVRISRETKKTILTCFMGYVDVSAGIKILEEHRIPHYRFPEEPARVLGAMARYKSWIVRPRTEVKLFSVDSQQVQTLLREGKRKEYPLLRMDHGMELLKAYGFPLLPYQSVRSEAEAAAAAGKVGFPVVLKILSQDIIHKFDIGGVKINLRTEEEVKKAYHEMLGQIARRSPQAQIQGALVQAMARPGREVILGMKRDPHFGPILMFGLGGIYVEALKDVTFRLAPIRELGAKHMIGSIRAFPLLAGIRGEKPSDFKAIMDCLERLSQLAVEQKDISEIDVNPLMVYCEGEGARVVDVRIALS